MKNGEVMNEIIRMKENNIFKRLELSLKKVGLKTTLTKAICFARNYLPKTPFERMMILRYRRQLDPQELKEPALKAPEYQSELDFEGMQTDVCAIAFFDPTAEKFSSESNSVENLTSAAVCAQKHGLFGFCFLWRNSGDSELMELLFRHTDIPLRYCVCRVREHSKADTSDAEAFLPMMLKFLSDPRYIRVEGKPLFLSLDTQVSSASESAFTAWRDYAREHDAGELQIWACRFSANARDMELAARGADAEVEFPPIDIPTKRREFKDHTNTHSRVRSFNYALLSTYRKVLAHEQMKQLVEHSDDKHPVHRTCVMTWNKPLFQTDNPVEISKFAAHFFYSWMVTDAAYTLWRFPKGSRFLFINGWNGGAEESRLAPDARHGYTYLNTFSKALFALPLYDDFRVIGERSANCLRFEDIGKTPRIAVHAHLYFLETMEELICELNQIPFRFDCYVSTDTVEKKTQIENAFAARCNAKCVSAACYPNRGRDVAPLLMQMAPVIDQYDYLLHVHGKKSTIEALGSAWRKYLMRNLLGHPDYVRGIIAAFENDVRLGIVFPETFPLLNLEPVRADEQAVCERLLESCGYSPLLFSAPAYPAGNMFWARTKAVRRLFHIGLTVEDFPTEKGLITATLAHHIERIWVDLAANEGYGYLKTWNCCGQNQPVALKRRIVFFVHYDKDCLVSDSDVMYVKELSKYSEEIVFITNSNLSAEELCKVQSIKVKIIKRKNVGFDFGAWKDAVVSYGFDRLSEFDQVVFANNSNFAPLWSLSSVFANMERRSKVDFWGITQYPRGYASADMGKDYIEAHIQSYFFVAEKSLVSSPAFEEFWNHVAYHAALLDVIVHEETEMTRFFMDRGFRYDVHLAESSMLMEKTQNTAPYMQPKSLVLMGSPLVKKKTAQYTFLDEKIKLEQMMQQIKAASPLE